jgi:hypothetical protein
MERMLRFSLKDILRGTTLIAIGCGMLAIANHRATVPGAKEVSLAQAFLVAFGGMLTGYGVAFPIKYPPYQMICAMLGMFAAQAWQSGSRFGLIVYIGLLTLAGTPVLVAKLIGKINRTK